MIYPTLELEDGYAGKSVAGIDEAGRGPLAGPVVAAACYIPLAARSQLDGVHDSKKLSAKKRERLFERISACCDIGVAIVGIEVIDEINILQATKRAMCEAYRRLPTKTDVVLVDGNQPIDVPCHVQTVIKGDAISLSIAAASIVAKVTRDRIMQQLHADFPHYGWDSNAGYGTKPHIAAIETHGITRHHRRSFAPIKHMI